MRNLAVICLAAVLLPPALGKADTRGQGVSLAGRVFSDPTGKLTATELQRLIVFSWDVSQEKLWRQIEVFRAPNVFPSVVVDSSGAFRLNEMTRDVRYIFDIGRLPRGWRIRSINVGAQDVQTEPYRISAGVPSEELTITLTRLPNSTVSGVVTSAGGVMPSIVVTFPVSEAMRTAPWKRLAMFRTGVDGAYKLSGLLEGAYYLVALPPDSSTIATFRESQRLKELEKGARIITVGPGSQDVIDIVR